MKYIPFLLFIMSASVSKQLSCQKYAVYSKDGEDVEDHAVVEIEECGSDRKCFRSEGSFNMRGGSKCQFLKSLY